VVFRQVSEQPPTKVTITANAAVFLMRKRYKRNDRSRPKAAITLASDFDPLSALQLAKKTDSKIACFECAGTRGFAVDTAAERQWR
jgi:hypothetical protein